MKAKIYFCILGLLVALSNSTHAQTFFETADGDGVIAIRNETLSQIKLNASSTAITYGYYYASNNAKGGDGGFICNIEGKVKPNDDGLATLVKTGKFQPGFGMTGALGYRFNNVIHTWNLLDFYIKPEWSFDEYNIYDTMRIASSQEPLYKTNKSSFKTSVVINYGTSIGAKMNLFLGAQYGVSFTNNVSDLDDVTIQTTSNYPNSTNKLVFSDVEVAKMGTFKNVTRTPFSADLIFDPGIVIGQSGTTTKLGVFTYFRTDGKDQKFRNGVGICFLSKQNPSKVYTSVGYEFPTYGKDVDPAEKKKDNGIAFATIGFSIN